jgi:hypothetical protein
MRRPLKPGTIIGYSDMDAEVVEDYGGVTLTVICEGVKQLWYWKFDGETCRVIKPA